MLKALVLDGFWNAGLEMIQCLGCLRVVNYAYTPSARSSSRVARRPPLRQSIQIAIKTLLYSIYKGGFLSNSKCAFLLDDADASQLV
jgi:hypothetical protein